MRVVGLRPRFVETMDGRAAILVAMSPIAPTALIKGRLIVSKLLILSIVMTGPLVIGQTKELSKKTKPASAKKVERRKAGVKHRTPAQPYRNYRKLVTEYDEANREFRKKLTEVKDSKKRFNLYKQNPATEFSKKFMKLAEQHPKSEAALQSLVWVSRHNRTPQMMKKVMTLLEKYHVKSKMIQSALRRFAYAYGYDPKPLLLTVIDKNPHREVQGMAYFTLGKLLMRQNRSGENKKLHKEALAAFARIESGFADVSYGRRKLGELAASSIFELKHLQIGMLAPDIEGEDVDGVKFNLSDYRGKVVVIDFWGDW